MYIEKPGRGFSEAQITRLREETKSFPNQTALGLFSAHSTLIEVPVFRTGMVRDAFVDGNLLPVRNDLQVLMHEMTHWFDFFGTIWGREYAGKICRAQIASGRKREQDFPKIVELFDLDNKILAPNYYRISEAPSAPHNTGRPWSLDYSCGCEIDPDGSINYGKPMFFLRFGENPSRKIFARQPISVGALLEVRAMAAEITAAVSAINSSPDKDAALTEVAVLEREMTALAYDHTMIEYNVAAHLVSVRSKVSEFLSSFTIASQLANIALNMTKSDFEKLRIPPEFTPFGKRNKAFKKNLDRGFAFACLVYNGGPCVNLQTHADRCVASSNLGSIEKVLGGATEALKTPFVLSGGGKFFEHFVRESKNGQSISEDMSLLPYQIPTLDFALEKSSILPPILDSECEFVEFSEGRIDEYDPDFMHEAAHSLKVYTLNLLVGCRGFVA